MILDDFKKDAKGVLRFDVHKGRSYELQFERYYLSEQVERIRVFGKEKEILLQCNRPEIKLANKRRGIQWKIISQPNPEIYKHPLLIATLTIELERKLDDVDFGINPTNISQETVSSRGK